MGALKRFAWILLTCVVFFVNKEPELPGWVAGGAFGFWAGVTGNAIWPSKPGSRAVA